MKPDSYPLVRSFWQAHKRRLIFLLVVSLISTLVSLSFPYLLKLIIDGIKNSLARGVFIKYIVILGFLGVARAAISVALPFLRGRTNEQFAQTTRNKIYQHILNLGVTFTNKYSPGDIIERLDQDLSELAWFACSGIFRPVEGIFTIVIALIVLVRLNPVLTLITILPGSIIVVLWIKYGPLVYRVYRSWREKISETNSFLESSFQGIKIIKSYAAEDFNSQMFHRILLERIKGAFGVIKAETKINLLGMALAEISVLLILWVGGIFFIKEKLTLGSFVAFYAYVSMLLTPMFDIGNFFVVSRRAQAQEDRLAQIINISPDVTMLALKTEKPINFQDKIEFRNISYWYPGANLPAVKKIFLEIPCGKKIGIVGTVASGKTTLIRLLLKLIEPQEGDILLDGCSYSTLPFESLRKIFGYVPQEASLFSDTIYNNIVFESNTRIDDNMLENIIEISQLKEDIKNFPNGIYEKLGSKGITLSGGQKQKVALARALITNPQILILDDATSNLDAHTEQIIIKTLIASQIIKTLIIVSHRLSVLAFCDYIYVLDKGEIVEFGNHNELLKKHGLYFKLYRRQLLEKDLEGLV
ncbi:MAG: ABC transporter ATP-binding protein/permease [candidate division WOR-3 bacterium]|nr:ABC transporter ATP-binding protein/permease [candidate division WOR-3 bacterium]